MTQKAAQQAHNHISHKAYHPPRNLRPLNYEEQYIVDRFHDLYYSLWLQRMDAAGRVIEGRGTIDGSWLGHRVLKCPADLMMYQEILFDTQPDIIIETGTFSGGSALFMASVCEMMGKGRIITVDINAHPGLPAHERITYLNGSSITPELIATLQTEIKDKKTMVILDSDHRKAHVLEELKLYHSFVSPGCYLIVEDTNVNGHPTLPQHGPGPMEAVDEFLVGRSDFVIDRDRERYVITLNPRGYLRKTA